VTQARDLKGTTDAADAAEALEIMARSGWPFVWSEIAAKNPDPPIIQRMKEHTLDYAQAIVTALDEAGFAIVRRPGPPRR